MCTKFCIELVERTLKPAVDGSFVLFCDNLSGQIADDFKRKVSEIGGVCWYGVPNATDIWQPVDAGYAEQLKVQIKHEHFKWLDSEENAEKWYNVDNTFSASERRILLTRWIGNAYNLIDTRFYDFRYRLFQKNWLPLNC